MTALSQNAYLSRSKDIAARTLGEDTIIMSTLDSSIFMLNGTGTLIWNSADGRTPLSSIIRSIVTEFDVTNDQARADAEEFITGLVDHRILSISETPAAPTEAP